MKRIFGVIICAALMAAMGASCSGKSSSSEETTTTKAASSSEEKSEGIVIPEIEKEVIWENDKIKVSTEYFKRARLGLKLKIENKSDSDLKLKLKDLYVNDLNCSDTLGTEIPAGETVYDTISFDEDDLRRSGISKIGTVDMYFLLVDENNEKNESGRILLETEYSEETKEHTSPDGEVLYDENGVKITSLGYVSKAVVGGKVPFYIENNSGERVRINYSEIRINGEKPESMFYTNIAALEDGKSYLEDAWLEMFCDEEKNKEPVESFEVDFEISFFDSDERITTGLIPVEVE